MKKKCIIFLIFFVLILIFNKNTFSENKKIHLVWIWQETGDCLWNIAKKYYGDPKKWIVIYKANKEKIRDPNKIYPKQKLIIPVIDGTQEHK